MAIKEYKKEPLLPFLRRSYSYGVVRGGSSGPDLAWWGEGLEELLDDLSAVQQGERRPYCEGVLAAISAPKLYRRLRKKVSSSPPKDSGRFISRLNDD